MPNEIVATPTGSGWNVSGPATQQTLVDIPTSTFVAPESVQAARNATGIFRVAQSSSPVVVMGSATAITATGAISGLTALPYQPSGVTRVYCYAQPGLAAGLYYATFSSTTACQLFTDAAGTVTPGGITAGPYTGGTTQANLAAFVLPGGAMGPGGYLEVVADWSRTNSVNGVTTNFSLGSDNATTGNATASNSHGGRSVYRLRNRGAQNRNGRFHPAGSNPSYAGVVSNPNIDTGVNQTMTIGVTPSNAADNVILEGYTAVIYLP